MSTRFRAARAILAALGVSALFVAAPSEIYADEAAQARRLRHFEWLRERGVFESMSVADGVPRLVIGAGRSKTDAYSLAVFCKIVFDYYAESDSRHSRMRVIDGTTGRQIGYVDANGYHDGG